MLQTFSKLFCNWKEILILTNWQLTCGAAAHRMSGAPDTVSVGTTETYISIHFIITAQNHTHTILMNTLGESNLRPGFFLIHLFLACASSWYRTKHFVSFSVYFSDGLSVYLQSHYVHAGQIKTYLYIN